MRPTTLFAACLALGLLTSCTPKDARLRASTAASIECAEAEIVIDHVDDGIGYSTWQARCGDARFRCRSQQETRRDAHRSRGAASTARQSTRCEAIAVAEEEASPEVAAPEVAAPEAPAREADSSPRVERRQTEGGVRLTLSLTADLFALRFSADPTTDEVRWSWRDPEPAGDLASCRVGLLIDGEVHALSGRPEESDGQRVYQGVVAVEILAALATAERGAGRLCEHEWRLDAAGRSALQELLARRAEDRAWDQASPADAGPADPSPADPRPTSE